MKKVSGLLALVVFTMLVVACSAPADEPAKKWVSFLDKHKAAIEGGTFDVKAFETEGKPLIEELKKHRDPKEKKILMTQAVLDEWNRANKEFGDAADKMTEEKKDPSAALAFYGMVMELTGEKTEGAGNAPANE